METLDKIDIHQFFDRDRLFTSQNLSGWFETLASCRYDIKTYVNQSINPEKDSPIGFAQRLLGTMGLKLTCIGQKTIEGERQRVYQMIDLNPDDRDAIFARWYERDSLEFQMNDLHTPLISNSEYGVCA
jgi:hypothetical protein